MTPGPAAIEARPVSPGSRFRGWVSVAVAVSVMLRVPFVLSPISTDEGGYLAIARAWRRGLTPYRDVWVDRPQGVLVLYRLWDMVWPEGEDWLRLISILLGALAVVAVASVARSLGGERAGIVAAFVAAAVSAHPLLEGYSANGELLAGSFSALCVALAMPALSSGSGRSRLAVAGAVGAVAFSMKQTGVDGPLAVGVWLALSSTVAGNVRAALRSFAAFATGAAVVLVPMVVHGWIVGGERYRYALWGYRLEGRSAFTGANWARLPDTGYDAGVVLLPVLVAVVVGSFVPRSDGPTSAVSWRLRPATAIGWWLACSVLAFAAGGQFFHHYWVSLAFPVAVVAGLQVSRLRGTWLATAVGAIVAVSLGSTAFLLQGPREEAPRPISAGDAAVLAEPVGDWLRAEAPAGADMFVMCVGAHVYAHAGLDPAYPFIWLDGIRTARDSQRLLEEMFRDRPPDYVVMFQHPSLCTQSALVTDVLATRYERAATVEGVAILRLAGQS